MIPPLKAISTNVASNPYKVNTANQYKNALNFASKGEKLNIDCNEMRSVTRCGKKLDLYA